MQALILSELQPFQAVDVADVQQEQRTAVIALSNWRVLFDPQGYEGHRNAHETLKQMGLLPLDDTPVAKDCLFASSTDAEFLSTGQGFLDSIDEARAFLRNPTEYLKSSLLAGEIDEVRSEKLSLIVQRQIALDTIDVESLQARLPFDIQGPGYFGRYLRQGEDPPLASRYLTSAAALLHQTRAIVESVADPGTGIVVVELGGDTSDATRKISSHTLYNIVVGSINNAEDLFQHSDYSPSKMEVITLPTIPIRVATDSSLFERFTVKDVSEDIAKWIVNGDKSGRALRARQLPWNSQLLGLLARLIGRKPMSILDEVQKNHPDFELRLQAFRERYQNAIKAGKSVVLRYTPEGGETSGDLFGYVLAMQYAYDSEEASPAIHALTRSGLLLNDTGMHRIAKWVADDNEDQKLLGRRVKKFEIPASDLNPSALAVMGPLIPQPVQAAQQSFRAKLLDIVPLPGISGEHAEYHFSRYCERHFPNGSTLAQDVEILFTYAPYLDERQFHETLLLLREHGETQLTEKTIHLAKNKFLLSTDVLSKYRDFCKYSPKKVGSLPAFFEDAASFENYIGAGLSSLGVGVECDQLERYLKDSNIVVVVDSTSYHPEMIAEIQGEKIESDVEDSGEVWGQYTRPGRRLVEALTRRIVAGESEHFQDYSVIRTRELHKLAEAIQRQYKKSLGIDLGLSPSLSEMNDMLEAINTYDDHSIVVIDAEAIKDLSQLGRLLQVMSDRSFKVVVRAREAIPGLPQVLLTPWTDQDVADRIKRENVAISAELKLRETIPPGVIDFTCKQVGQFRKTLDDPLNLAMVILQAAGNHAAAFESREIIRQDVVAALPAIFHLPDPERTRHVTRTIDQFVELAPEMVLGQKEAIKKIATAVKAHLYGTRNPSKPLSILIPGPTGVGKTELLEALAQIAGVPFCKIQGSHYTEPHSGSALFGSPPGYVGPDQGDLFCFLRDNPTSIVFIDEYEKMHPEVYKQLMEFADKGAATAGDGETVYRPGTMIFAATNAGAADLRSTMSTRQIKDNLVKAFATETGIERPELVARWDICPMLAIAEDDFEGVVRKTLREFGDRFGLVAANIAISGFDDYATKLLYETAQEVCAFNQSPDRIGFTVKSVNPAHTGTLFYDLRFLNTAFDRLAQESVVGVIEERHLSGASQSRGEPMLMKLEGDEKTNKILLVAA